MKRGEEGEERQCSNFYHVSENRLTTFKFLYLLIDPHTNVPTSVVVYSCFVLYRCRSSVLDIVDTERKKVEIAAHRY